MENDSLQVMQEDAIAIPVTVSELEAIEKSNIDMQVATAKRYPRNVALAISNAEAMATMDLDTAKSCGYALQRQGKTITGPTVHLAKIIASNWGNLRSEARVVGITGKQVISRGICWDLETNNAAAFETRRRITDKNGKTYSDDMVTVTGNAASAIAYRNAVFSVIPLVCCLASDIGIVGISGSSAPLPPAVSALWIIPSSSNANLIVTVANIIMIIIVITNATNVIPLACEVGFLFALFL